ncbi:MAG: hypothetical protein FD130_1692, partial [Halothiobacillaceae bacterium]
MRGVLRVDRVVVVVVTKQRPLARLPTAVIALFFCWPLAAAILPEDRADLLYHLYDGGGIQISGPSLLVRKQLGESTSFAGNYYVDSISSASIDVVTSASQYKEERTEKSLSVDYLHENSTLSAGYTISDENDYNADTVHLGVSQTVFGELTTL